MIADKMEIDELLKEIYAYLQKRKENKDLTEEDKKKAEELIEKSKKQLQKLAKMKTLYTEENVYACIDSAQVCSPSNQTEDYVAMNGKSTPPPLPIKNIKPPKKQKILIENPKADAPTDEIQCPFRELPAKEASQKIKFGTLLMRRKVLSIIGRSSKVFGAIHESWLLIYRSSKESKPFYTLNLKVYKAKKEEPEQIVIETNISNRCLKKYSYKMCSFRVFEMGSSDKKGISFIASTPKDMEQWVVNINRGQNDAMGFSQMNEESDYEICDNSPEPNDNEELEAYEEVISSNRILVACSPRIADETDDCGDDIYNQVINRSESPFKPNIIEENEDDIYVQVAPFRQENVKNSNISKKPQSDKEKESCLDNTNNTGALDPKPIIQMVNNKSVSQTAQPGMRQKFSSQQNQMETFSRNSKTFQASPTSSLGVPVKDSIDDGFELLIPCIEEFRKKCDDEKPMVLLKPNIEEENCGKKIKKPPITLTKPKKLLKK